MIMVIDLNLYNLKMLILTCGVNGSYVFTPGEISFVETPKVEDTPKYTKTEINRMPLDDLKALATEKGVDGADDMTGGELKKLLIDMFNL